MFSRLKEGWLRRRKEPVAGHERAGFLAEAQIGQLIEAGIAGTSWRVFHGPRIPAPKEGRCREVDFVVVGHDQVWMVECKHWSGEMEIVDGDVIQHRRNNNGFLNHGDTFGTIAHKGTVLSEYHGAEMPEIVSFVVFSNQNLEIPDDIMARDDCMRPSDLLSILPSERNLDVPIQLPDATSRLVETLEGVGSWDLVHLHGGREYNGDLLSISDDSGSILALFNDRTDYDCIIMETERKFLRVLLNPRCDAVLMKDGREMKRCVVNPSATVNIRRAARSEATSVPWRNITRIDLLSNPQHHNMRKRS